MRNAILACFGLGALLFLASGQAHGQQPLGGPYAGSTVSPYLNLNRAGSSVGLNYYNLVRPEFSFQSSINGLQQGQFNLTRQVGGIEGDPSGTVVSGHRWGYMTHTRYFLNNRSFQGGRQGGQGAQGAQGAASAGGAGTPGR